MNRTRVKICGITRPEDGQAAGYLGADAVGLVFYAQSPRAVDMLTARRIIATLPPFVMPVGLFFNADPAWVRAVLRQVPLGLLQFHGNEEPEYCAGFGMPYIKAVPMATGADIVQFERRFATAAGLLLDSYGGNKPGGTGQGFDWRTVPVQRNKPVILAGGLTPDNVADAIVQVRPFAVDVSSGVESAKGIKDRELMQTFVQNVARGDSRT